MAMSKKKNEALLKEPVKKAKARKPRSDKGKKRGSKKPLAPAKAPPKKTTPAPRKSVPTAKPAPEPAPEPVAPPAVEVKPEPPKQPWVRLVDLDAHPYTKKLLNDIRIYLVRGDALMVRMVSRLSAEIQMESESEAIGLASWLWDGGARPYGLVLRDGDRLFITPPYMDGDKLAYGRIDDNGRKKTHNPWPGATTIPVR